MPTPLFNFRLPREQADSLRLVAKIYGAPSAGGFVREMVMAMCSGQPEQIKAFVGRLIQKSGEQLTLQLTAPLDAVVAAQKPAQKPRKQAKGKRGGRHARRAS